MPEIRLLALDLDGTLLTGEKILAQEGVTLLRRASQEGLREEHTIELVTTTGTTTFYRQRPGQPLGLIKPNKEVVGSNYDALVAEPLRILVFESEQAEKMSAFCRSEMGNVCQSEIFINPDGSFQSLAIGPRSVDKRTGLKIVLDHLVISTDQVMAIGDNYVDIPMFRLAGLSVAMGNAPWEVKQSARVIAPSNNEEGVAWVVKKFFLDKEETSC